MKKIFSLVLIMVLSALFVMTLVSCEEEVPPLVPEADIGGNGGNGNGDGNGNGGDAAVDDLAAIDAMFDILVPKQSTTTVTQQMGNFTLTSVSTLKVGMIGGMRATTYNNTYDVVQDLVGATKPQAIAKKSIKTYYVEGRGLYKDGKWDKNGQDFAPTAGMININLDATKFKSYEYDSATGTLVFVLDRSNANTLLASFMTSDMRIPSDTTVTIKTSGGRISAIKIEYIAPVQDIFIGDDSADPDDDANYIEIPSGKVTVEAVYSYDIPLNMTLD